MFYSHDFLTNVQSGVATIWFAATAARSSNRKLNRRTIQGVNVPKACETILDPGAPLALRLQGNLLYGVSKVFSHQCMYVLADAEKVQSDMMTFFRVMNTSETDPKAGKTKRQQITLADDPNFDVVNMLPKLDELFSNGKSFAVMPSQESATKFSQMSPLDNLHRRSSSSSQQSTFLGLDLPSSSHSFGTYQLPVRGGPSNSPFPKEIQESDIMPGLGVFPDDELDPFCGVGLDFDADGNLVGVVEPEAELPPLPGVMQENDTVQIPHEPGRGNITMADADEAMIEFDEAPLPDAEPFEKQSAPQVTSESTETGRATSQLQATRRRRRLPMIDGEIRVPRDQFRGWTDNYATHMVAARNAVRPTTLTQAKRNALGYMYNYGISNVGLIQQAWGVNHPLATDFAGTVLKAHLLGLNVSDIEDINTKTGRRRKSPEAFEEESNQEHGTRNVRQRLEGAAEDGRGFIPSLGEYLDFGDDAAPEVGRDAAGAMEDRHSPSIIPFGRHGSAGPGSSVRGPGSAQKSLIAPSPLHGAGSVLGSIERHSDPVEDQLGAVLVRSQVSSYDDAIRTLDFGAERDTQKSSAGLESASQRLLQYLVQHVRDEDDSLVRGDDGKTWIDFEEVAGPDSCSKALAAQMFLGVLSLATKRSISVNQVGRATNTPFGAIHIGMDRQILDVDMME